MKILLIEDEAEVALFLRKGLTEEGYEVTVAYDGKTGEKLAVDKDFDIIILDIILPDLNGFSLCRSIRKKGVKVPVLMLTALGTTDDKVSGFDAGSDDYLVKPFEFEELLARLKALSRRSAGYVQTDTIKIGDLSLDLDKRIARRKENVINLTGKEFELLELLMKNRGRVMSRAAIAEKIWDFSFDTGTNVVDVYISILRKKIDKDFEPKLIHTKFGTGYFIEG